MIYQTVSPPPAEWDAFVEAHPRAHLLQTSAWGVLKTTFGWQAERIALARDDGSLAAGVQILYRPLPLRLGRLAYAPFGPLVDWADDAQVRALTEAVDRAVKRRRGALLKIEPGYGLEGVDFTRWGFRLSPQTVQPPRSYLVDLSADEDTILARMNQGTRRNIRKSERFGVTIREGTRDDLDSFNALLHETGARDAFGVHAPRYYEHVYERFVPQGRGALLLGSYDGHDLAGVMVFALADQGWYLYGASSERERQRMASYGVQWAGMRWAKARGARCYDMVGVPDAEVETLEAQFPTRSDGLWGVYRFKRGWGGTVVRSAGAWDRVYNPLIYALYRFAVARAAE